MIRRAFEELGLEPARSYVVGDQAIDMELTARVGATGVWICDSAKAQKDIAGGAPHLARDLWDASQWIAVSS
jgi:histidinol phosphatase-like enzyme